MPMRETKRLLIVDDDPQILCVLRAILETENYHVTPAHNGAEMLALLASQSFDLITLDLGLPGVSGVELAREVCLTTDIPVIVVSGRCDDYDRIVALELGADDYIVKPFNGRELVARVRAVLRRASGLSRCAGEGRHPAQGRAGDLVFHSYHLNMQTRKLRRNDGATTELTSAECALLEVLIENAGRACTQIGRAHV